MVYGRADEGFPFVGSGVLYLHERTPFDHFCFWARLPGVTHEQALQNMRLFASEVGPRARDAAGT